VESIGGAPESELRYADLPVIPTRRERSRRCRTGQFDIRESRWNRKGWKDGHNAKALVARKKARRRRFLIRGTVKLRGTN